MLWELHVLKHPKFVRSLNLRDEQLIQGYARSQQSGSQVRKPIGEARLESGCLGSGLAPFCYLFSGPGS